MAYRIEISRKAEDQMEELEPETRRRIREKIDEISRRIKDWNVEPDTAVEKRLKGRFSHILQQRVGDHRIWFEEITEDEVLLVSFIGHKEEVQEELG